MLDAEETLARLMDGDGLRENALQEVVAPVLDGVQASARYPRVRAFGEMVNLVWERGRQDEAVRLEDLWNRLLAEETLTLLCAYRADPLEDAGTLERMVCPHGRVLPGEGTERVTRGLEQAAREVLGPERAAMLRAEGRGDTSEPSAELAVLWLRAHMPRHAQRILVLARRYAQR